MMRTSLAIFVTGFALAITSSVVAGRLLGDTITNSKGTTLQFSVGSNILAMEKALGPACKKPQVIRTAIVGEPRKLGRMMQWNERWTIDRCGAQVIYLIHFDFRGSVGTFKIEPPTH